MLIAFGYRLVDGTGIDFLFELFDKTGDVSSARGLVQGNKTLDNIGDNHQDQRNKHCHDIAPFVDRVKH